MQAWGLIGLGGPATSASPVPRSDMDPVVQLTQPWQQICGADSWWLDPPPPPRKAPPQTPGH